MLVTKHAGVGLENDNCLLYMPELSSLIRVFDSSNPWRFEATFQEPSVK
jgi:hypothetical protein